MRRTVWMIRHAMPDIPLGERWCVGGRSDFPLGTLGHLQAALLPYAPELHDINAVYCSSLLRARQTALPLCASPKVMPGLEEQDMGEWDGLSFAEIKIRFPELYAAREGGLSLLPAGAESEETVRARVEAALLRCLEDSSGDIAVVSHKGAIASLTGHREKVDYTSLSPFVFEDGRLVSCETAGVSRPPLSAPVCETLLDAAGADDALRGHCRAVAAFAEEIADALRKAGRPLDADAIRAAAMLHDLARREENHAALGARWLSELGYPEVSDMVRQHHDPDGAELNEAAVVFIADKAVRGTERVPIAERFSESAKKCSVPEAAAAHQRRYGMAKTIREAINMLCGMELIP